ncbi:heme-binding protein [Clostridium sp. AM29-11AC]|nr:heme-binding protein [Clostridium sp. AM29-11AC]
MTLGTAKMLIEQGEKEAEAIGVPMVISVVDEGGNLTALHRMDSSLLASLCVSQSKAFTALALRAPTGEAAKTILPGQPLYGLQNTHPGQFCLFGGGFPLMSCGCCIGAVGVSGGTTEQDTAVGERIVQWFEERNQET